MDINLKDSEETSSTFKRKSSFRRVCELCDRVVHHYFSEESTTQNDASAVNTSSPVNKRRGFSGRKWLPPPLRKLSQGKVEKQTPIDSRPPLKKTGSDKRIKVPTTDMGNNKSSVSEGEEDEDRATHLKNAKSLELTNGDEDDDLELPPPMKPIQESMLVPQPPAGVPGVPEIEENPCKREQHSENKERHAALRNTRSSEALSEFSIDSHKDLSAQCSSNEAASLALSGDESDKQSDIDPFKVEVHKKKRSFVIKELLETEEFYVRDLSLVVEGYCATMRDPECEIPMPEDLREGKDKMVFGNIEQIYEWHKNFFLKTLRESVDDVKKIAQLFTRSERKLQMYVIYCQNKPISEYIVAEHLDGYFEELRNKLGHKLQLCDLLIKPVQRISKYHLLLGNILKDTEKAGIKDEIEPLRKACKIMDVVPKNANDMMDVGRLQGFSGKITAQGKLLLHGMLTVSDLPGQNTIIGKNKELQVFLFEQSLIFSDIVGKKTQFTSPQYIYKAHIQVNKMTLDESRDDCLFTVTSTHPRNHVAHFDSPKTNSTIGFICAAAPDERNQWLKTIKEILQTQRDFTDVLQNPIAYQNKLTKESSEFPWEFTRTTPIDGESSSNLRPPRKPAHYIHKANTIGIPSENDLSSSDTDHTKSHHHHKSGKRNFFDGFKSTLKNKHKSDSVVMESGKESEKNDLHRRWSETQHSVS